jgi:hypothetical protein
MDEHLIYPKLKTVNMLVCYINLGAANFPVSKVTGDVIGCNMFISTIR